MKPTAPTSEVMRFADGALPKVGSTMSKIDGSSPAVVASVEKLRRFKRPVYGFMNIKEISGWECRVTFK